MEGDLVVSERVYLLSCAVAYDNCEEARRLFYEKYHKEAPPIRTVRYWKQRFIETGKVASDRSRSGRPKSATSEENRENVLQAVAENPSISIRDMANELNISIASVSRILKNEKYHDFKPNYCQLLYGDDEDRRLEFCENIQVRMDRDPAFIRKVKFSDECVFSLSSRVNTHNVHQWAKENPHFRLGNPGKTLSLTVWVCIGHGGLVSHDISEDTMNSERYVKILNENVLPAFNRNSTWIYQQDGASSHYSIAARAVLNNSLPGRWIGRRGPIEWPARSPDLTPCDFWFWAYLREKVYDPPGRVFANRNALKVKIEEEIHKIPLDMYRRSITTFQNRIAACISCNGDLFE